MRLLYASEKPTEEWGILDVFSLAFFSVITVGILPLAFIGIARTRRRRMRRFFRDGTPGVAEITKIELEKLPFEEKIARVSYQFEAEGQLHRDSDAMLPSIAHRLQPGDQVPILYVLDRDYDSVIVAVE